MLDPARLPFADLENCGLLLLSSWVADATTTTPDRKSRVMSREHQHQHQSRAEQGNTSPFALIGARPKFARVLQFCGGLSNTRVLQFI
jgi:hypothetical protein